MGFRGEALASIAAVSHAQIVTRSRQGQGESGYEISCGGDELEPVKPAPSAVGTTLSIRDLFFNVPARRKFLRSSETEFGHIAEQLCRLALPRCDVAFTMTHNGRSTHRLPVVPSLAQRVEDLFGDDLAGSLVRLDINERGIRISGLLGAPAMGRASSRWQYFFVNGRYVRDRFFSHALKEAYRGLMEPSRSPVAFVFIEIDPAEVDVNVHPAKIEVRFRNGQLLHSQLLSCLRETLRGQKVAPQVVLPGEEEKPLDPAAEQRRQSLKQAMADFFRSMPPPQPRLGFDESRQSQSPNQPPPSVQREDGATAKPQAKELAPPSLPQLEQTRPDFAQQDTPALQVHNSYILTADDEGVLIIDQHALHERVLFEELTSRITAGPLAGQRLLIPQVVTMDEPDKARLFERNELLDRLGIELTDLGPGKLALQRFPALLSGRNVAADEFLRDLADLLAEHEHSEGPELLREIISTIACKAAVKAGDPLTPDEMQALISRRGLAENASSCPHGRPTTLKLTLAELAKQFKRT
jgi:DNA mismatch repair protein MutL